MSKSRKRSQFVCLIVRVKAQEKLAYIENYRRHKQEEQKLSNKEVDGCIHPYKYNFLCFKKKYPSEEELNKQVAEYKEQLTEIKKEIDRDLSSKF